MRTLYLLALPLLIFGCKTKPPPAKPGADIGGAIVRRQEAKHALSERAKKACEYLANSKESPENIGQTVVSTCAVEISTLVDRLADEAIETLGRDKTNVGLVQERKPKWKNEIETQVYRDTVAWVVIQRTDRQSAQEK